VRPLLLGGSPVTDEPGGALLVREVR
jgi:hypothetical protein